MQARDNFSSSTGRTRSWRRARCRSFVSREAFHEIRKPLSRRAQTSVRFRALVSRRGPRGSLSLRVTHFCKSDATLCFSFSRLPGTITKLLRHGYCLAPCLNDLSIRIDGSRPARILGTRRVTDATCYLVNGTDNAWSLRSDATRHFYSGKSLASESTDVATQSILCLVL